MSNQRAWRMGGLAAMFFMLLMIPGFIALNEIPAPAQAAPTTVQASLAQMRADFPAGQILTVVPDVYHRRTVYRYRVRTINGRLWHFYIDVLTGRIIARVPVRAAAGTGALSGAAANPRSRRAQAIRLARSAVGGGQIVTVETSSEDQGRTYVVKLLLTNGQYANVHVIPKLSKVLAVQIGRADR
ncbi:MAG: PepSY domain-containing protein [Thermaerobacter sp.]|nr:PepSY domain-containing protein [Thermaerobacter sp.]